MSETLRSFNLDVEVMVREFKLCEKYVAARDAALQSCLDCRAIYCPNGYCQLLLENLVREHGVQESDFVFFRVGCEWDLSRSRMVVGRNGPELI